MEAGSASAAQSVTGAIKGSPNAEVVSQQKGLRAHGADFCLLGDSVPHEKKNTIFL